MRYLQNIVNNKPPRGVSILSWWGGLSMSMTLRAIPAVA